MNEEKSQLYFNHNLKNSRGKKKKENIIKKFDAVKTRLVISHSITFMRKKRN